jgi:hypothetical protein
LVLQKQVPPQVLLVPRQALLVLLGQPLQVLRVLLPGQLLLPQPELGKHLVAFWLLVG